MELIFAILVVIAVIAVAGVVFCLWAAFQFFAAIGRAIWPKRVPVPLAHGGQTCNNRDCLGANPVHARFCRRCGRPLPAMMRLVEARAA